MLSMFYLMMIFLLTLIISSVFWSSKLINNKEVSTKEKLSPFECGFDPGTITRMPFCIKFFLIAVIFLVFDIEVALIIPLPFSFMYIQLFLLILIMGLFYEWFYGGLNWMNKKI